MQRIICAMVMVPLLLMVQTARSEPQTKAIEQAVNNPARPAPDLERDAGRKPGEVLGFFGVEPGMTVLDVFSGGGYYAEIVSRLVGPEGKVITHNNDSYIAFVKDELAQRYPEGRLSNVTPIVAEANDLHVPDASVDAALLVLGFHDIYYVDKDWPVIDTAKFMSAIYDALKPGGVFGVIDHRASAGSPTTAGNDLHRIDPAIVKQHIEAIGFVLEAESDILKNPEDDLTLHMGDPKIRGKTDRFVFRFRKPS